MQQHRNAFVSMQACSLHVAFQLPNEHSRVGFLLDGIENDDAGLQAAIANVEDDNGVDGKRNDFEKASSHLLPKDPVVKRSLQVKRGAGEISEMTGTTVVRKKVAGSNPGERRSAAKVGIGNSGVHLRYHTPDEYGKLTRPQKRDLSLWRNGKVPDFKKPQRPRAVAGAMRAQKELAFNDDAKKFVMSLLADKTRPVEIAAAVAEAKSKNSAVAEAKAVSGDANPDSKKNVLKEILRKTKG